MLAVVSSGALLGIRAEPVQVEVNTYERGEAKVILVGLPDTAVKESNDRVISALNNCGFTVPRTRTTINLAPGNIRKEGPISVLQFAVGYLAAPASAPTATMLLSSFLDMMILQEESSSKSRTDFSYRNRSRIHSGREEFCLQN